MTEDDPIYGIHHVLVDNKFKVNLVVAANINSLNDWWHIIELDEYASQPAVWVNDDGSILVAYERTGTPNKNYCRIRYYKSFEDLKMNKFKS